MRITHSTDNDQQLDNVATSKNITFQKGSISASRACRKSALFKKWPFCIPQTHFTLALPVVPVPLNERESVFTPLGDEVVEGGRWMLSPSKSTPLDRQYPPKLGQPTAEPIPQPVPRHYRRARPSSEGATRGSSRWQGADLVVIGGEEGPSSSSLHPSSSPFNQLFSSRQVAAGAGEQGGGGSGHPRPRSPRQDQVWHHIAL